MCWRPKMFVPLLPSEKGIFVFQFIHLSYMLQHFYLSTDFNLKFDINCVVLQPQSVISTLSVIIADIVTFLTLSVIMNTCLYFFHQMY